MCSKILLLDSCQQEALSRKWGLCECRTQLFGEKGATEPATLLKACGTKTFSTFILGGDNLCSTNPMKDKEHLCFVFENHVSPCSLGSIDVLDHLLFLKEIYGLAFDCFEFGCVQWHQRWYFRERILDEDRHRLWSGSSSAWSCWAGSLFTSSLSVVGLLLVYKKVVEERRKT